MVAVEEQSLVAQEVVVPADCPLVGGESVDGKVGGLKSVIEVVVAVVGFVPEGSRWMVILTDQWGQPEGLNQFNIRIPKYFRKPRKLDI